MRHVAFFSEWMHEVYRGKTTVTGFDQQGQPIRANWIGPAVELKPGVIVGNTVIRPAEASTYVWLGPTRPGGLTFPKPKKALPNSVFSIPVKIVYGG